MWQLPTQSKLHVKALQQTVTSITVKPLYTFVYLQLKVRPKVIFWNTDVEYCCTALVSCESSHLFNCILQMVFTVYTSFLCNTVQTSIKLPRKSGLGTDNLSLIVTISNIWNRCSVQTTYCSPVSQWEVQLSPADHVSCSISVEILSTCCIDNANRLCVSLYNAFCNIHCSFGHLRSF